MEHIKQNFSIKDLEHLSGIKAHTIRIWEKRYDILDPERTDTNIRTYNGENLQKLLNIAFLRILGLKVQIRGPGTERNRFRPILTDLVQIYSFVVVDYPQS